jgi:hypothetical protein
MIVRTIAPKTAMAGCADCPAAGNCAVCPKRMSCPRSRARGATGLGCAGCPHQATCSSSQALGALALPSIDMSDWKTWLLIALAAGLLYQMFFSQDTRVKRRARRQDLRTARERYADQVRKIRESYA